MPWICIWAQSQCPSGQQDRLEEWRFFKDIPTDDCLKDEAMEFGDGTYLRHSERGFKYGFDDPVDHPPEEVRVKLVTQWEMTKLRAECMLKLLEPPPKPPNPLDRMASALGD